LLDVAKYGAESCEGEDLVRAAMKPLAPTDEKIDTSVVCVRVCVCVCVCVCEREVSQDKARHDQLHLGGDTHVIGHLEFQPTLSHRKTEKENKRRKKKKKKARRTLHHLVFQILHFDRLGAQQLVFFLHLGMESARERRGDGRIKKNQRDESDHSADKVTNRLLQHLYAVEQLDNEIRVAFHRSLQM
jgi:hypothetical protein